MDVATIFEQTIRSSQGVPTIIQLGLSNTVKKRIRKLVEKKPGNLIGMVSFISKDDRVDLAGIDRMVNSHFSMVNRLETKKKKKKWSVVWRIPTTTGYGYMIVARIKILGYYYIVAQYLKEN